jgi:hypothetical protein
VDWLDSELFKKSEAVKIHLHYHNLLRRGAGIFSMELFDRILGFHYVSPAEIVIKEELTLMNACCCDD